VLSEQTPQFINVLLLGAGDFLQLATGSLAVGFRLTAQGLRPHPSGGIGRFVADQVCEYVRIPNVARGPPDAVHTLDDRPRFFAVIREVKGRLDATAQDADLVNPLDTYRTAFGHASDSPGELLADVPARKGKPSGGRG